MEQKRFKKINSNFIRLIGDLNQAQSAQINYYINLTKKNDVYWRERRVERKKELINFLKTQPSEAQIEKFLVDLFLSRGRKKISDEWWVDFTNLLIGIFTSLEKSQLIKLLNLAESYSFDVKAISNEQRNYPSY